MLKLGLGGHQILSFNTSLREEKCNFRHEFFQHTNDKDIGMYVRGSALYRVQKKLSKEHGIYQNVCTKIKFDKNSSTDTTWKYNI